MKHAFLFHRSMLLTLLMSWMMSGCKVMHPEAVVPFQLAGRYAVIQLYINGTGPLRFILDTGVRNTIITEMHTNDSITLQYSESRKMQGLGEGATLNALVSEGNLLQSGKMQFPGKTVFLIEDDIFKLSQQNGTRLNGLAGIDLFENHIVKLDYSRQKLYFYNRDQWNAPKGYEKIPLILEGKKVYLNMAVLSADGKKRPVKMFLDTGAQMHAWFQNMKDNLETPDKTVYGRIGQGFGGEIHGYYGKIPALCLGNQCLQKPIVVFPDSITIAEIVKRSDRDGTVGIQFISRFDTYFDLKDSILYLKPNFYLRHASNFNIAGAEVNQPDLFLPRYEISNIWKDSPAQKAGLKVGDTLLEINGESAFTLKISEIQGLFEKASHKKMELKIIRNDVTKDIRIDMNNPF